MARGRRYDAADAARITLDALSWEPKHGRCHVAVSVCLDHMLVISLTIDGSIVGGTVIADPGMPREVLYHAMSEAYEGMVEYEDEPNEAMVDAVAAALGLDASDEYDVDDAVSRFVAKHRGVSPSSN